MISRDTLGHRIQVSILLLSNTQHAKVAIRGETARLLGVALDDLVAINKKRFLDMAHRHLSEHEAGGLPRSSMPAPSGSGGLPSDRTGGSVVAPYTDPDDETDRARYDPVDTVVKDLDECTTRLAQRCLEVITGPAPHKQRQQILLDAKRVRRIIERWAEAAEVSRCTHCWETNRHWSRVFHGRYRHLCRDCGEWKVVNHKLPPADILPYLQRNEKHRIPQRLLNQHRAKIPRPRRRGTKDQQAKAPAPSEWSITDETEGPPT